MFHFWLEFFNSEETATGPKETWFPDIVFALASLVFLKMFEIYMKNLVEYLLMNLVGSGPNCFK